MTKDGAIWRRWFWLRDLVLPAGQAAGETIPLYAVLTLVGVNGQRALALNYSLLAGLVAAGAWSTRLTGLLPASYRFGRVVLTVVTAIGLVFGVHAALAPSAGWDPNTTFLVLTRPWVVDSTRDGQMLFAAWFLTLCLWSRGLWIGLETINARREAHWFIGGMAILLGVAAVLAAGSVPESGASAGFLRETILWYFFVGLLVLALAHASTLRGAGGPAPGASLSWLLAVAIPVVAIPLAGMLFTFGAAPVLRLALRCGLALCIIGWQILLWISYWLLLFFQWLSNFSPSGTRPTREQQGCVQPPEWLLQFRHWLSSWFGSGGGEQALGQSGCAQAPPPMQIPEMRIQVSVSNSDMTVVLLVLVFSVLFVLLSYLLMRRRANVDAPGRDDERSSAWSWALFLSQLGGLWATLLGYWRGRTLPTQTSVTARSTGQATSGEDDIRSLYRRFLRRAGELNHHRPSAFTPLEFARSLGKSIPGRSADIAVVSGAYDRARYGEKTIGAMTFLTVRDAVVRFEADGHKGVSVDGDPRAKP